MGVEDRIFVPREMTDSERRITDFDPTKSPEDRLYGYAARHFVDVNRLMPLTRFDREDPLAVARAQHFERLIEASGTFLHGLAEHYHEMHDVESWRVIFQAQDDVHALGHNQSLPAVETVTVETSLL